MSERTLPNGWRWVKLRDVCKTTSGGTPSRGIPEYFIGKIPWVKSGELTDGLVNECSEYISNEALENSSVKVFPAGTLLMAMYGATVGKLGVLGIIAATNQAVCAIFVGKDIYRDYLFHYLKMRREELVKQSFGGAQPNISQAVIQDISVPLPPLDEQRRIAAILDEQMAAVEQARVATQAQLEAAKQLTSAYLREIFGGENAQEWETKRLGDILYRRSEIVHPHDNPHGPATFVGLEHVESGTGIRIGNDELEMSELTGRKPQFFEGDIVYGYLRPYLNKVWVAEFDGLCSVDQYPFKVDEDQAITDYVAWYMRSPVYLDRSPIGSNTSQLPRIRLDEVMSVEIELPPLDSQRQLVSKINKGISAIMKSCRALQDQVGLVNKLPAALLRRAFSGEL